MKPFVIACALSFTLAAQQLPDAATIEKRNADLLKAHPTIQYVAETTIETTLMGASTKVVSTQTYQFALPNKLRMEARTPGSEPSIIISDGESIWIYDPVLKQYAHESLKDGPLAERLRDLGVDGIATQVLKDASVVGSETIDVDGRPRDCWVEESHTFFGLPANLVQDPLVKVWIDKENGFPVRTELSASMSSLPGGGKLHSVTVLREIQFDRPLAASLFEFKPPDGAKESPFALSAALAQSAEAAKSIPGPQPEPPRVNVAPGEPQAFVPNLRPLTRIYPKYPDTPLPSSIVDVSFLVTVDPAGQVAKAEVLTGNAAFRDSALEAIQRTRFRPVLRDGKPVYAYTRTTILFTSLIPGEFKPETRDMAAEREAGLRIVALQRKFPRTPLQMLTDLEQDSAGATGIDRSSVLPELAKTAIRAGVYDKAALYADEMLKQSAQEYNYQQAVFDGHMVRGLISLRQGNVEQAKRELLESAATKGTPVLSSFGPNMTLAKELLEKGERETVLAFFDRCGAFWKSGQQRLAQWTATVRGGGTPDFGANLSY